MCPNIKGEREGEEGRDGKFNLLCPLYKKRKKIYIKRNRSEYYKMMGWRCTSPRIKPDFCPHHTLKGPPKLLAVSSMKMFYVLFYKRVMWRSVNKKKHQMDFFKHP